jgi:3-hydroxyisobutyrate dehydrogenase-like beta-hydroxyacid dehydrogenase
MQKIGFIGMGIMGRAMAPHIMKAGYEVTVYNRTAAACDPLVQAGARMASSPLELAEAVDMLVIMLTGPEACDAVLFGEQGAAPGLKGKIVANMSSVAPAYTEEFAERLQEQGIRLVDAPVSGSKKPAEDAQLVILAGGAKADVDAAEPVLSTMGKAVVYCGEHPAGSMMKMSINLLLGICMEGLAEMMAFGEKGGLSKETMFEVLLNGAVACPMFKVKQPMLMSGEYPTQFPLKHMAKDMKFVVDTAHETGAFVPSAQLSHSLYRKAEEMGLGDEDFAAILKGIIS